MRKAPAWLLSYKPLAFWCGNVSFGCHCGLKCPSMYRRICSSRSTESSIGLLVSSVNRLLLCNCELQLWIKLEWTSYFFLCPLSYAAGRAAQICSGAVTVYGPVHEANWNQIWFASMCRAVTCSNSASI